MNRISVFWTPSLPISPLPRIPSTKRDAESCLTITKRNLSAFPGHIWKVLRRKEKLFPKHDDVEPRELTPKQATKIIVLRLLMILHNCLIIWRVTVEKNNPLYVILALTVVFQVLEGIYSLLRDRRIRKRWRPCFVVYFASVIPSFWILQYEQRYRILEGQQNNTNSSENDASADGILDEIQGLNSLESSTWFLVLLEIFAYIILIGRLLHDSITKKILTQQMIGFLINASDIFELFSLFDEEKVIEDDYATLSLLIFWNISFIQFIPIWGSHNLGNTQTQHRDQDVKDKKFFIPFCNCSCRIFNDGIFDDGSEDSTEKYETGFSWLFQDCPFLLLRLYFMIQFNLYTHSLIFYSLKNISITILFFLKFKLTRLVIFCIILIFFIVLVSLEKKK